MDDRFTHYSKHGRGNIPKNVRSEVFRRDKFSCLYCGRSFSQQELTIDHLVPLMLGGLDEITNYVTCCKECNQKKSSSDIQTFANQLLIPIEKIPVHGDPIIDNEKLPIQIRIIRKKIYDRYRHGQLNLISKSSQQKIEKVYRRKLWETRTGKELEEEFPYLPGQVRAMIPEIRTIVDSERDFILLLELAKSANTRNLINKRMREVGNIEEYIRKISTTSRDEALKKRTIQALIRFEKKMKEIIE